MRCSFLLVAFSACGPRQGPTPPVVLRPVAPGELRSPADFQSIVDRGARSRALFAEAGGVLQHPRCVNCHPNGDVPHQGMQHTLHDPPVVRGPENDGVPGNECTTCHQNHNQQLTRVPGAPKWHLAPIEMAWAGKSLGYLCRQLQDPLRNGGRTLAQIVDHSTNDELVAWGWSPGHEREAVPGTQKQFGALIAAWVETGAQCPAEDKE